MDRASRLVLAFDSLKLQWGESFNLQAIEHFLSQAPALGNAPKNLAA